MFCPSPTCLRIQKLDDKICNFYDLFNLGPVSYDVDPHAIETSYRDLQKKMHPDKVAQKADTEEKEYSKENSALINRAHQILRSPVDRAFYIVSWPISVEIVQ
jgi:molecular chaperone HscB